MTFVQQLFGAGKHLKDLTRDEYLEYRRVYAKEHRLSADPEERLEMQKKQRLYCRRHYEKNRDALLKKGARNTRANPEASAARARKSYLKRREKITAARREKYWSTPKDVRKAERVYKAAVRKGLLVMPETCERCQERKARLGHHEDYSKPLQVTWLCVRCHRDVHGRTKYTDEELGIK